MIILFPCLAALYIFEFYTGNFFLAITFFSSSGDNRIDENRSTFKFYVKNLIFKLTF